MTSVSRLELANKVVELLSLKPGEPFEIAKTRDGSIILKRIVVGVTSPKEQAP
jgi:hypothetical protein